jgi:hypothetical protein
VKRLLQEMRSMETSMTADAILFYPQSPDGIDVSHTMLGVIRLLSITDGGRWAFHTTLHVSDSVVAGFGVYGDLETVAKAALYQFGSKLDTYRWDCLTYSDPAFPNSLIPESHDHERACSFPAIGWDHRSRYEPSCSALAA